MEFSQSEIARLVLGYLKQNKFTRGYNEVTQKLNIDTNTVLYRVQGLSLEDYLKEYAQIFNIIEKKVDATNYYKEFGPRTSLADKLLYLFNNSRELSPKPNSSDSNEVEDCTVNTSPPRTIQTSQKCSSEGPLRPKRKVSARLNKSESAAIVPETITKVLQQKCLEREDLSEKLAETINEVLNTRSVSQSVKDGAIAELDATIKNVVKKTSEDPDLVKIINDIIGTTGEALSNPKPENFPNMEQCSEVESNINTSEQAADQTGKDNEVIVYEGSFESYIKTSCQSTPQPQNPVYYNQGGLLMVQNQVPQTFPASKPLYIVNNQPLLIPQINNPPKIITDQDILTMPTVIVNDVPRRRARTNKPKPKPEPGLKRIIPPKVPKKIASKPEIEIKIINEPKEDKENRKEETTPKPQETVEKRTPRSGSHVRNLDFSSPPKITSTNKKNRSNSSPPFVHKKQAAKTLFKSNEALDSEKPKKVNKGDWDADLRKLAAATVVTEEIKPSSKKRKRKSPVRSKKKSKNDSSNTTEEGKLLEEALKTPMKNDSEIDSSKNESLNQSSNKSMEIKNSLKTPLKTILSPSKLKANKRNLVKAVNIEETKPDTTESKPETKPEPEKLEENKTVEQNLDLGNKSDSIEKLEIVETPETIRESSGHPIKANRNIIPLLETPVKYDQIPKTPGLTPYNNSFTPFSKVIEEHLHGVDLSTINTPNLPITPGLLTFTPGDEYSPYNRPTDYSTSSSYYQPSDNEHNKSIEQILNEEANKPERPKSPKAPVIISNILIEPKSAKKKPPEQLRKFNQNVIGKKNLNLLKKDSCSSTSSESDSDSSDDSFTEVNKTVICNEVSRGYSLRSSRRSTVKEADKTLAISEIIKSVEVKSEPKLRKQSVVLSEQEQLFKDLEAKKMRTLMKIKNNTDDKTKKKPEPKVEEKEPVKKKNVKKPVSRNKKKPVQKSGCLESKIKQLTDERLREMGVDMDVEDNKEKDEKEEAGKKVEVDEHAQDLMRGMKEMGFHLFQNKSPKKTDNMIESISEEKPKEPEETVPESIAAMANKLLTDEDVIRIVHDEEAPYKPKVYDIEVLKRSINACVYFEELKKDVEIPLKCTPLVELFELPSEINVLIPKKVRSKPIPTPVLNKIKEKDKLDKSAEEDRSKSPSFEDLMNIAVSDDFKSNKKKKMKPDDGCSKTPKTEECQDILRKLGNDGVDNFLNKVHGESR